CHCCPPDKDRPWTLLRRWAMTCCLRFGFLAGSGPLTKIGAMVDAAAHEFLAQAT
ncbi:hypothetical protein ACLOJK_034910, partial [Asimina triloba]